MRKIIIPTAGGMVDDHFGHCACYTVFSVSDAGEILSMSRMESPQGCGCKSHIAQDLEAEGIREMVAGHMGQGAYRLLSSHGVKVTRGCHGPIQKVLEDYLEGLLKDSGDDCHHTDCPSHDSSQHVFKVDLKPHKS